MTDSWVTNSYYIIWYEQFKFRGKKKHKNKTKKPPDSIENRFLTHWCYETNHNVPKTKANSILLYQLNFGNQSKSNHLIIVLLPIVKQKQFCHPTLISCFIILKKHLLLPIARISSFTSFSFSFFFLDMLF